MKFGGTSVGSPERMKSVAQLITRSGDPTFVVLSAMSGTTNSLVEISNYLYKKNPEGANEVINNLETKYMDHVEKLYQDDGYRKKTRDFLRDRFGYMRSFTKGIFTSFEEKIIVSQGEIMSTNMVNNYLQEQGIKSVLVDALSFMRTNKNSEPDLPYIKEHLHEVMEKNPGYQIYITQGFICRNAYGEVDNLLRGGSDYTASLIGAALPADEIQIWTDIDGMHNNDPRFVDHTTAVHQLNFEEAAELAYFGAKILHPTCVYDHQQRARTRHHQGCGCEGQHHGHQDQVVAYAPRYGLPTQGLRDLRELSDTYRHDHDIGGRGIHEYRQQRAPQRDRG